MGHKYKLAHPIFIISVSTLIINDFYLKHTFHNYFTGKLSDFVGLFAFPFFWTIIFPKRIKGIHLFTIAVFLYWKSEFSQPFIDFINLFGLKTFRTVDYTDYVSLISVLLSYYVVQKPFRFEVMPFFQRLLYFTSLLAFVATTQKREKPAYGDDFKTIDILNQGNKKLTAVIEFKYAASMLQKDSSLNNEFNRNDTIELASGASQRLILPIKLGDSAKFPDNFKITVLNDLGTEVKIYNKALFLKNVDTIYNKNGRSEYSDYWSLAIGEKMPEELVANKIYGRWETIASSKKQHSFEIRKDYYYDVAPNSEVGKWIVQDSTIKISYNKKRTEGRVLKLDEKNLTIKWDGGQTLKYKKVYN